jgi:SAM-dependent methyltransferase
LKRGPPPYRLNVGCGRNVLEGWINLDAAALPGVDLVADLERVRQRPLDLAENSVQEFLLSHVIEHVRDSLGLMQELWRLAAPGALAVIRVPHGGNDEAWEDPTHVRPYFVQSFSYFSQPSYWRADYGYRGDWQPRRVQLLIDRRRGDGLDAQQCFLKAQQERNLVREMVCELQAVKPRREPRRELQAAPEINVILVD